MNNTPNTPEASVPEPTPSMHADLIDDIASQLHDYLKGYCGESEAPYLSDIKREIADGITRGFARHAPAPSAQGPASLRSTIESIVGTARPGERMLCEHLISAVSSLNAQGSGEALTAGERFHLHEILDSAIMNAGGPLFRGRVKSIKEKLSHV